MNLDAAGIDVGASSHSWRCPKQALRSVCGSSRRTRQSCTGWPTAGRVRGVETVAMESTGVYWIAFVRVLEERGLEVLLVDPRRLKSVPGRKTDVLDCQWQQQLHTYGLLSGRSGPRRR